MATIATSGNETALVRNHAKPEMVQPAETPHQSPPPDFDTLYHEHYSPVYRFLRNHFNGPEETVEDLVQEVFIKAWSKVDQYQTRGLPFSAWLFRIARNHLGDFFRRQSIRSASQLNDDWVVADPAADYAMQWIHEREWLMGGLEQLSADQRRVVELRFLADLSVADTAQIMGKNDDSVKKLQARGLANLRRLLATAPEGHLLNRQQGMSSDINFARGSKPVIATRAAAA